MSSRRKRPAVEEAHMNLKREAPHHLYGGFPEQQHQNEGYDGEWQPNQIPLFENPAMPTDFFFDATSHQDYLARPEQAHTPPMENGEQEYRTLTDLKTPAQSLAQQIGSLLYTPPSPDEYQRVGTSAHAQQAQPYPQHVQHYPPQGTPSFHGYPAMPRAIAPAMAPAPIPPPTPPQQRPWMPDMDDPETAANVLELLQNHIHLEKLDRTPQTQPLKNRNVLKDDYQNLCYPTYGTDPEETGGNEILEVVGSRLPAVGMRFKCRLTVDELKRRTGYPEHMNLTSIYGIFRKSKKKETINHMKSLLEKHKIDIPRMQRQRKLNCFSAMLEDDAVGLAKDFDHLNKNHYPYREVAQQMVYNLMSNGHSLDKCIVMLKRTTIIIERVIKTMSSRQPAVNGQEEILKGTPLDLPYHVFSLSNHGFGHAISLSHYQNQLQTTRAALIFAGQLKRGDSCMQPPELVVDDEPPFAIMSQRELRDFIAFKFFNGIKHLGPNEQFQAMLQLKNSPNGEELVKVLTEQITNNNVLAKN